MEGRVNNLEGSMGAIDSVRQVSGDRMPGYNQPTEDHGLSGSFHQA